MRANLALQLSRQKILFIDMREVCRFYLVAMLLCLCASAPALAQQKAAVDRMMDHYLGIHSSLAKNIGGSINKEASELAAAAEQLQSSTQDQSLRDTFGDMARRARVMSSRDLNATRFHFSHLSDVLIDLLNEQRWTSGYHFFRCEAHGKYWIQRGEEPMNPYASGGRSCGEKVLVRARVP